jgi:hypothetical protein
MAIEKKETRYYYQFDSSSELGKRFRRLWNHCVKAEKAQETFRDRVGAVAFCPNDEMFAGGVLGVYFADDAKVNRKVWQEAGKSDDGSVCWVPICKKRQGALLLAKGAKRPADTATRLFGRPHTDEKGRTVCRYIELYRDDKDSRSKDKRWKMPHEVRESIRIERARIKLPVVEMLTILNLLQADYLYGLNDGKVHVVRPVTPTFFEYWRKFYVCCAYPCHAEVMQEIASGAYAEAASALREVARNEAAMKAT